MNLSVSELAKLMGISARTLHYYDEIGLLKPSQVSEAGYRSYDDEAISLLQQILFYRELEFSLGDIRDIISRPDYDREQALRSHRELLVLKKKHIDELLSLVDDTLGGNNMSKKKFAAEEIAEMKKKYAAETQEKWGKTPQYAESEKKASGRTDEDNAAIAEEANEIFSAFASAMDKSPSDEAVQELVKRWQSHITKNYYECSKEILSCLGEMYVADERFTANIDRFGDGTAQFMRDAICAYCE